ncbi:MAG: hypothetical protein QG653_109 [Patescibacteria group bacterium]|nr:hypothetical protein [Patescibacteria group bacterium]
MKKDEEFVFQGERMAIADYRKMSREASVRALGVFWRKTGLRQYQVADKYGINRVRFRMWASRGCRGGPILKKHYKLLIAMFYPHYEEKAHEIFWMSPASIIKAYRKHINLSKTAFAKQYGLDRYSISRWEKPGNPFSPALNMHFVLVKQILRFAVARYERRQARMRCKQQKQSHQNKEDFKECVLNS